MNNDNKSETPETREMHWHPKFNERGSGCPICGKAMKRANQKGQRYIHVGEGGASIIRADLEPIPGREGVMLSTGPDTGDMGWFEVGPDCASKLGREWTKVLEPITGPFDAVPVPVG